VIGKLFVPGVASPYRHPKLWARETLDGRERLRIGAGLGTVELLRAFLDELAEPFVLLVVMRAPRVAGEPGRWESDPCTRVALTRFLDRFGELFEDDARAELWLGEADDGGLLVLDEHDLIYAYGPLHRFQALLRRRGYRPGNPRIPEPHEHHYNHQFDGLERELDRWEWRRRLPLEDES